MVKLTNFKLSEKEREDLRYMGQGSRTRGIRAMIELINKEIGRGKASKMIKKNRLGFK